MAPRDDTHEEDPDPEDVLKILIATDNHLGFGEKFPERQNDSYITFDEILQIGRDNEVDLVLLGGDLFHDNRPTRNAEHNCMKILKKHVFGDRPVSVELVSDPETNFQHCDPNHRNVNYMDPNLNIALPIFSIHGNHDDPCGMGGYCSLDNLHTAGLVNYFGRINDLKEITVNPLLFKKGENKFALYGLSSVKDERLYRLFRESCVKMLKPEEDTDSWFNLLVLHQNRTKRSVQGTNYIPEHFIDGMFDLVVWGHEHECRLAPEELRYAEDKQLFVSQPGSSVATSLCEAEAIEKKVGILTVHRKLFKMEEVPLKTVRPLIFKTVNLAEDGPDLSRAKNENDAQAKVERFLKEYIEDLLKTELPKKLSGHPNQPVLPLVRVRVEYEEDSHQLAVGRFGNNFHDRVANPADILLFKKVKRTIINKDKTNNTTFRDPSNVEEVDDHDKETIEDHINEHFENEGRELELLGHKGITKAVNHFITKNDKAAIGHMVNKQMENVMAILKDRDVDEVDAFDEALKELKLAKKTKKEDEEKEANEIMAQPHENGEAKNDDLKIVSESEDDEMEVVEAPPPAKRGRGSRGGARGSTRGTRGRGRASPMNKKPVVTSTPGTRRGTSIRDAFAKQSQVSSIRSQRSNNIVYGSDSD